MRRLRFFVAEPEIIFNKRVLVIEDGPTLTHGEMKIWRGDHGSSQVAASEIVDPGLSP